MMTTNGIYDKNKTTIANTNSRTKGKRTSEKNKYYYYKLLSDQVDRNKRQKKKS